MNQLKSMLCKGFAVVERNKKIPDLLVAVLLALCPLLQHYVAPLYNFGISALILIAVYLIVRMLPEVPKLSFSKIAFVLPMVIYQIYRIINHGTTLTEFGQSGVFIVVLLAIAFGKINTKCMMQICRAVCLVASVGLIVQTVVYYLFHTHVQMVVTSWLIPAAEQWIGAVETGLISITGKANNFYRPTAFFLEPAHVYIYMFPHLILILFNEKLTKKTFWTAALISAGMVLSTSGMGVAAVLGVWAAFLLLRNNQTGAFELKNVFRKRNLVAFGVLLVAAVLVVISVPSARRAVTRIFVPNVSGTTAITGRLQRALKMVTTLEPLQWVFGVADNTHGIEFHIPGLLDVLYRHGLIGFVLSYELYVKCIAKLKMPYKFVGIVILITSVFSAHTHSTIGMLNFLLILMSGFQYMDPPQRGVEPYVLACDDDNCVFRKLLKRN